KAAVLERGSGDLNFSSAAAQTLSGILVFAASQPVDPRTYPSELAKASRAIQTLKVCGSSSQIELSTISEKSFVYPLIACALPLKRIAGGFALRVKRRTGRSGKLSLHEG